MGSKRLLKLDHLTPADEKVQTCLLPKPYQMKIFCSQLRFCCRQCILALWQSAWGGLGLVTLLWHSPDSGLAEQTDLHFTPRGQQSKLKSSGKQCRQHKSSGCLLYVLKTKQLPNPQHAIKVPKAEKKRDNYCTVIHNNFMSQNPLCMNFSFFSLISTSIPESIIK